jgi:ATP-dependent RNA helicase DHR2
MPENTHKRFLGEEELVQRSPQALRNESENNPWVGMNSDCKQEPSVQAQSHGEKRDSDGNPVTLCSEFSDTNADPATRGRKAEETGQNEQTSDNGTRKKPKLTACPETFYNSNTSPTKSAESRKPLSPEAITPKANIGKPIGTGKAGGKGSPKASPASVGTRGPLFRTGDANKASNGIRANESQNSTAELNELESKANNMRPSRHTLTAKANTIYAKVASRLPIQTHKADIRWALRNSDVLLLVGETGSGKSTQVPQFLVTEPWCKKEVVNVREHGEEIKRVVGGVIAVTEPRRVAAISLAQRVAAEMGSYLARGHLLDSDQVGYSVRFDTLVPCKARIKFLTEGMLLQEFLHDPNLLQYSAVIIDEIHERSVDVDLVAGFLRNIVRGDKSGRGGIPLKLVIMSATANMERVQNFFAVHPSVGKQTGECPGSESNGVNGSPCSLSVHDTSRKLDSQVNGINSDGAKDKNGILQRSDNPDDRRASDASYSTWDGIADDDESKEPTFPTDSNISMNGHYNHGSAETTSSIPKAHISISPDPEGEKGLVVHHIKGRQHPVKILYTPEPVLDYVEAMLKTIFKIHTQEPLPGDILAFLTGQEEIETLQNLVEQYAEHLDKSLPKIRVLPLYGHLSIEQQQATFVPMKDKRTRKVVLATNIAETSVTVPGVFFVIDCGKAKIKRYRPRLGLQSLLISAISKSSAIQRKGRAGREAPGKCFRLYTEAEYLKLPETDLPEILRSDVAEAVLKMKARGIQDVVSFPLMDPPEIDSIEKALLTLHAIGTLDDNGKLNEIGQKVARFPLQAAYGRVLVAAAEPDADCLLEAIDVISCLTAGDDIFLQTKSEEQREEIEESRQCLIRREGDILTYLTTMQRYTAERTNRVDWCEKRLVSSRDMKQALDIRRQLRNLCVDLRILAQKPPPDPQPFEPISVERGEILLKCFMKAFATKTASLHQDGSYLTTQGRHIVAIHPSSVLYGRKTEAIMFLEHVYTQKNYAKKVSAVQMNWIAEVLDIA